MDFLFRHKPHIDERLTSFLRQQKKEHASANTWSGDLIDRLLPFVVAGKTTRGSLVVYIYSLFHSPIPSIVYDAAAALELFHAGLLIHDDVMDTDDLRRGAASIHTQYEHLAGSKHFGISMGITAGDICFFLGNILLPLSVAPLVNRELVNVAVAQMQDVAGGALPKKMTQEEIVQLYRYKTARYSFSLPMMMGATLTERDPGIIKEFENLGEVMGMLYQLRDDELSVSGNPQFTGKPIGSDQKNAKQTIASVLSSKQMYNLKKQYIEKANTSIQSLPIKPSEKTNLEAFVTFCHNRQK